MGLRIRGLAVLGLAAVGVLVGVAAAVAPDDFVGPPLQTANGCPADVEWSDPVVAKALGLTPWQFVRARDVRGLSNLEMCTMPRAKLKRAVLKSTRVAPDSPSEWAKFRALQQSDDTGTVRLGGLMVATAQRNLIAPPAGALQPLTAGIQPSSWIALGPGNVGGRIRAISPNPSNASDILVGGVAGGIWRTTNGGTSWAPVNDFMANLAVSTIVRDPQNSQVAYAGTGEGFFNADAVQGYGIFKSTDGGANWAPVAGTTPVNNPNAVNWGFYFVNRIAVHPTNSNVILAATSGQYCNRGGLLRSTDGGANWSMVYNRRALDVKFDPNNVNRVLVAEGEHCVDPASNFTTLTPTGMGGSGGGAVAVSTDAGATFTYPTARTVLEAGEAGRVEIAWAPATSGLVVAILDANGGSGGYGRLYRSTDGGATWAFNSQPGNLGGQGWYDNTVWVDPTDSKRIVVGGLDLYRSTGAVSWWVANSALTWTKISQWFTGGSVHADHHAIIHSPSYNGTSNRVVYFGNDGGLYKSNDIAAHDGVNFTANWVNLNNGLAITQFYGGAGHSSPSYRLIGGAQDNGSVRATGTTGVDPWNAFFGGDGGYVAVDPTSSNIYYGEYVNAAVHRTVDGVNGDFICDNLVDADENYCLNGTSFANFISPFILDPNNANTMLVGAIRLWRSPDVRNALTPTWQMIKSETGVAYGNLISAVAVAPGNSNVIWVGQNNGALGCTTNGTAGSPAWTTVTSPASRFNMRIVIDPSNSSRVIVSFGGYASPNIYVTTSGCTASPTWTSIHNNLPQAPVRTIALHPSQPGWMYVGTEVGIFASTDSGATWSASNEGPGNIPVDELFWLDSSTLAAATHGRGMFKAVVGAPGNTLTVSKAGAGVGTVTSSPAGIACGATCSAPFAVNAVVTLTAAPAAGSTFSAWSGGGCSGSGGCSVTMSSAQAVTATFGLASAPGAPQNLVGTPGNGSASFVFSAPASDGGSPITSYAVSCTPGPVSNSGAGSPLTVNGLTNGITYTCSATATNAAGTGPASAGVTVTPTPFSLVSAVSRHTHSFPTYDIPIDITQAIGGAVTVEPRAIGSGHKVIFTFPLTITFAGTVSCKDAGNVDVGSCTVAFSTTTVTVTIPTMPDGQRVTISLANVNGVGAPAAVSVAFLKGDVNGTRSVTASDILAQKGKSGSVTALNAGFDVDLSNSFTAADITAVKANAGASAP